MWGLYLIWFLLRREYWAVEMQGEEEIGKESKKNERGED